MNTPLLGEVSSKYLGFGAQRSTNEKISPFYTMLEFIFAKCNPTCDFLVYMLIYTAKSCIGICTAYCTRDFTLVVAFNV